MPLLAQNDTDFASSVYRSGPHFQSRSLKGLVSAVKKCQDEPDDRASLYELHTRLWEWRQANPKEYKHRGGLFDDLLGEIQTRATQLYVTLVVPNRQHPASDAWAFVNRVRAQLDEFKECASADAYLGSTFMKDKNDYNYAEGFAGCINPSERQAVRARHASLKGTSRGAATPFDSHLSPGEWKATKFRLAYDRVMREKAGICATFAQAAAHVLTTGQTTGPRVEVVSFRNHVYVLVNRSGDVDEDTIPPSWLGDPGVVIVDGWAAAMGYESVYVGLNQYPYVGMLNPLILVASWPPPRAD